MHDEQIRPVRNRLPSIQSLVRQDINDREQVGISRYGTYLQAHNGRDALVDAYEEALDLATYLRQLIYERDNPLTPETAQPPDPSGAEDLNDTRRGLIFHLVRTHGSSAVTQAWATSALIQKHLNAHRVDVCDHDYGAWG